MIFLDFYFLGLTYLIVYVGAIMILFLFIIMMVQIHLMPRPKWSMPKSLVVNYFYPAWSIELKTMSDLSTLANLIYVGYPTALIFIALALWVVLIGIIRMDR
jgi:NADH:ubiquinone oxidoreductase subunit 6 (subunit J)